eukprot:jgi/Picre1/33465/NNA_008789.t1
MMSGQIQIKPKSGTGPVLLVETGRSTEYYQEQIDAFRRDHGIQNEIDLGIIDNPGILPVTEMGNAPSDVELWWDLVPDLSRIPPRLPTFWTLCHQKSPRVWDGLTRNL